jgi:ketose-bisphosphate aldolase
MPLVDMKTILAHARANGYAAGYFESWNLESLLAVKDAAESTGSPVIIGFNGKFLGNKARRVKENIHVYGALGRSVAEQSAVPMAFILNEADDPQLLLEGLRAGFNVIMHDHEGCSFEETVQINSRLVAAAHQAGASVEAEIGELPSGAGDGTGGAGGRPTDPGEAERFVERTGIDALAVAVGNIHILEGRKSRLDLDLIRQLRSRLSVPLVLHGGTGIHEADLKEAIRIGICKINVGTLLRRTFVNALKDYLAAHDADRLDPGEVTSTGGELDMLAGARARVASEVARLMRGFGSAGMAAGFR